MVWISEFSTIAFKHSQRICTRGKRRGGGGGMSGRGEEGGRWKVIVFQRMIVKSMNDRF